MTKEDADVRQEKRQTYALALQHQLVVGKSRKMRLDSGEQTQLQQGRVYKVRH